jgi:hypothetical protein
VRILLLADLHIGARLLDWGEASASRRTDTLQAWEDAVELALAADVAVVMVAGDLFDGPDPEAGEAAAVADGVSRLLAAQKPVVILPGAYDGLCRPSCFYLGTVLPADARVVDWPAPRKASISVGEETLHLYSFASIPGRTPPDPFAALRREDGDGYHVGLVHADLEDEVRAPAASLSWGRPPLSREQAGATALDLLVVGGGHGFRSEICGVVPVVQPGSPVQLRPDDDEARPFAIAQIGPEGVEIEKHPRMGLAAEPALTSESALPVASAPPAKSTPTRRRSSDRSPAVVGPAVRAKGDLLARIRKEGSVRGLFARRLETLLSQTSDPAERDILRRALALGLDEFNRLEAPHAR